MKVDIHGAPIYFEIPILGGIPITGTLVVTWGVMLVLTLLCIWMTHDMKVKDISKKQAVAEMIYEAVTGLVKNNMGERFMGYVPLITALFGLSVASSLSSLLGLWAPTADVNTELGWPLGAFVLSPWNEGLSEGLSGSHLCHGTLQRSG